MTWITLWSQFGFVSTQIQNIDKNVFEFIFTKWF